MATTRCYTKHSYSLYFELKRVFCTLAGNLKYIGWLAFHMLYKEIRLLYGSFVDQPLKLVANPVDKQSNKLAINK